MATPDVSIAKWVGHPRSYTSGRKSGQPSVIVIHTTDGHEGPNDAENGAAYDKRRTDGTSTHYFVDSNSIVQEVEHKDESHAARSHDNDIGIQIEICGLASQTSAQWDDPISKATLENAARLVVAIRKTGNFGPVARLTPTQLRAAWNGGKIRGICGHVDITNAFPEDNGTHTDPGSHFPWTAFLNRIKALEAPPAKPPVVEDLPVDSKTFNSLFLAAMKDPAIRVEVGKAVLEASGWSVGYPGRKLSQHADDDQAMRNFLFGKPDKDGQQIPADAPVAKMARAADAILAGGGTVHTS